MAFKLFVRILRGVQATIVCYVLLAVLYTTKVVLKSSLCVGFSQAILYPFLNNKTTRSSELDNAGPGTAQTSLAVSSLSSFQAQGQVSGDVIYSTFLDLEPTSSNKSQHAIAMMEDLFLSKAFAQSMQPNKIVPFFYKATGDFDKEDITITTLITRNRFKVFARLVQEYQGERNDFHLNLFVLADII
jgi:glycosyltransferase-like protein LARGE